ncbi:MAG: phosphoribosylglycinamide formyltransferase [Paracoccaceae bacterium]
MRKRVAILISGGGSNMLALLNDMAAEDHPAEPVLVISNNPDSRGLARAAALGVETAVVDHRKFPKNRAGFEAELHKALTRAKPDIICLAGFMRILSPEFVRNWAGKIINIHPSILPLFPGLHTHEQALKAGMAVHGCTVHLVDETLDGGPILGQSTMDIDPDDTPETLAARLLKREHMLYPQILREFAAGLSGTAFPTK